MYCNVLYCNVLSCKNVLWCDAMQCIVMYCTVWQCNVMLCYARKLFHLDVYIYICIVNENECKEVFSLRCVYIYMYCQWTWIACAYTLFIVYVTTVSV